jgi:predicted  nucleic acid-binding Zn-ribbon protein
MPKSTTADIEARLKDVVTLRGKLEKQLEAAQDKLRQLDRQRDADKYAQALGPVNQLKQEIGQISNEHAELARVVSMLKGGQNHSPTPG